jgi:putative transcriptional regulator
METQNKCHSCGNQNVEVSSGQSYHFRESGLDNVFLLNIGMLHCPDCESDVISIPSPTQLLNCISEAIILSPSLLSGQEVRFLRKNLHLKIDEFARIIGVDRVTVSRWENGHQPVTKSSDRLIRLTYVTMATVSSEVRENLRERLKREDSKTHPPYEVRFPLDIHSCALGEAV